jgi:hypothetical protein
MSSPSLADHLAITSRNLLSANSFQGRAALTSAGQGRARRPALLAGAVRAQMGVPGAQLTRDHRVLEVRDGSGLTTSR